jgi:hypothetical protein
MAPHVNDDGGFIKLTVHAADDGRISHNAFRVLVLIARAFNRHERVARVTSAYLASKARISRRTVRRAITLLIEAGYLTIVNKARASAPLMLLRVLFPDEPPSGWIDSGTMTPWYRNRTRAKPQPELPFAEASDGQSNVHLDAPGAGQSNVHHGGQSNVHHGGQSNGQLNGSSWPKNLPQVDTPDASGDIKIGQDNQKIIKPEGRPPNGNAAPGGAPDAPVGASAPGAPTASNGKRHSLPAAPPAPASATLAATPPEPQADPIAATIIELCPHDAAKRTATWEWVIAAQTRYAQQGHSPAKIQTLVLKGVRIRLWHVHTGGIKP